MMRKFLLGCGVVSSLLYVGIDFLAAAFYGGYHSFTSQAISELMARGAPTERMVDPLFLLYDGLLIAFGVGVWVSTTVRPARVSAALLIASAVIGFTGPTLFEMNLRGTGASGADVAHIVVTAVLSLVLMLAIGFGAFARGRRFQLYSFASIAVMLLFGALTGVASRGLSTGDPTPWLGLLERICIGASLAWVAVFALALMRAPRPSRARLPGRGERPAPAVAPAVVRGAPKGVLG
jgi:lysylphosphatidylglycerol synthetase-like protein (DUF2156 family)